MDGISLQKVSAKFSVAIVALICTTLVYWAWGKTPVMSTLFPSLEQFAIFSPGENSTVVDSTKSLSSNETKHVPVVLSKDPSTACSSKEAISDKVLNYTQLGEKECNYAKGKWVADTKRPLYSGSSCKQWLSPMWACRLMQRTDFSYEGYRWQPQGCEMPEFSRSDFFKRMQNKTLAFVGDSLGRQQFQSLMCMVTGGEMSPEVEDVGKDYGLVKAPGAIRPDGWAYKFPCTNTTILYYWSASLCELEPLNKSDAATNYALHLDRPTTFLKEHLSRFDVLVLNTGHHWNRDKFRGNRWEMYAEGEPVNDGKVYDMINAKKLTLYSIVRWVDSHIMQRPRLKAFLRTMSPRHFVNGDWNTGGSCNNTVPLAGGSEVLQDGSNDHAAEAATKGARVKLLDITAISQLRDEAHISNYTRKKKVSTGIHDCLHWCLPGVPDMWNEILYAQL